LSQQQQRNRPKKQKKSQEKKEKETAETMARGTTRTGTDHKDKNWRRAMNVEFNALLQNRTWTLVPPNSTTNVIGCKRVFRVKRKADGSIDRYKARLVAKGFHQQPGIDYGETYSPVIKPITVHIVPSIALSNGWPIHQINIQNAFPHGDISKVVYMS
jgi:hypothetical protein